MPGRAKLIRKTVPQERKNISLDDPNIIFEKNISDSVISNADVTLSQYFSRSRRLTFRGASPIAQNLLPSRLKSGNTKRVVRLERTKQVEMRFKKAIKFLPGSASLW